MLGYKGKVTLVYIIKLKVSKVSINKLQVKGDII